MLKTDLTETERRGLRWLKYVSDLGLSYDRFPRDIFSEPVLEPLLSKGLIAWGRRFDCDVIVLTPAGQNLAANL